MRSIDIRFAVLCAMSCIAFAMDAQIAPLPECLHTTGFVSRLRMHWRVRPLGHDEARWGVVWNVADSSCYDGAEMILRDARYTDAFGRESACLRIFSIRDGLLASEDAYEFSPAASMRDGGGSLRLSLDRGASEAVLSAGFGEPEISVPVAIVTKDRVGCYSLSPCDTLRHELCVDSLPEPIFTSYSIDSLRKHLSLSRDVNEGEWVYYDRDTDPVRLSVGGDYRFATISDGRGGYDIVYISGAVENAEAWPPMRVKGRLLPTGFIGQFDLVWYDAYGEPMGGDCSALITDGMLLEIRFPLYGGNVRYRRDRVQ